MFDWPNIMMIAGNAATLIGIVGTTVYRMCTVKAQFEAVRDQLAQQTAAAARTEQIILENRRKIESIGRHADLRYMEQPVLPAGKLTAEQERLRAKLKAGEETPVLAPSYRTDQSD